MRAAALKITGINALNDALDNIAFHTADWRHKEKRKNFLFPAPAILFYMPDRNAVYAVFKRGRACILQENFRFKAFAFLHKTKYLQSSMTSNKTLFLDKSLKCRLFLNRSRAFFVRRFALKKWKTAFFFIYAGRQNIRNAKTKYSDKKPYGFLSP